jgi:hypothetical protein
MRPKATWMGAGLAWVLLLPAAVSCADRSANPVAPPDSGSKQEIVLAPGAPWRLPEPGMTITFEQVVQDSRCPTGLTCIVAGDAAVRIRFDAPGTPPSSHVLHTNLDSARAAEQGAVRVTLTAVAPYPAGDTKPRPEEYRVTLLIERRP